jgi:hypothetical protein
MPAEISAVIPIFRMPALLKDAIESALVHRARAGRDHYDRRLYGLAQAVVNGFGSIDGPDRADFLDAQQAIG